jgi:hypothetical protein
MVFKAWPGVTLRHGFASLRHDALARLASGENDIAVPLRLHHVARRFDVTTTLENDP